MVSVQSPRIHNQRCCHGCPFYPVENQAVLIGKAFDNRRPEYPVCRIRIAGNALAQGYKAADVGEPFSHIFTHN